MSRSNEEIMDRDERLEKALTDVEAIEPDLEKALNDEATKEHTFKIKQAEEYLKASGTVDERKAKALTACKDVYLSHLKAVAVKDFIKAKLKDRQDAVSARQSLLTASVKTNQRF
jgi:hypothetical protein